MTLPTALHLFCRVVDNYGDIGVCWRLARQLHTEFGWQVTLLVDELRSFQRLEAAVDPGLARQWLGGIRIVRWDEDFDLAAAQPLADVVIEAFGCTLPEVYIQAMAAQLQVQEQAPQRDDEGHVQQQAWQQRTAWINLEYLSAESWVEGCHENRSLYPAAPLSKYFYFPGFTERTGGLLLEQDLLAKRDAFQSDPAAMQAFLASIGVFLGPAATAARQKQVCASSTMSWPDLQTVSQPILFPALQPTSQPTSQSTSQLPSPAASDPRLLSLFCYPDAPLDSWFAMLAGQARSTLCLVPEGVATLAVEKFLGKPAVAGASASLGRLTVQVVPFLDQVGYDRLLWCCDMNLVRGEDSLVRAVWAGRPLLWDIYPQQDQAHLVKLDALLDLYCATMTPALAQTIRAGWHAWSRRQDMGGHAAVFSPEAGLERRAAAWGRELAAQGGLAMRLIRFLEKNRLKYGA